MTKTNLNSSENFLSLLVFFSWSKQTVPLFTFVEFWKYYNSLCLRGSVCYVSGNSLWTTFVKTLLRFRGIQLCSFLQTTIELKQLFIAQNDHFCPQASTLSHPQPITIVSTNHLSFAFPIFKSLSLKAAVEVEWRILRFLIKVLLVILVKWTHSLPKFLTFLEQYPRLW